MSAKQQRIPVFVGLFTALGLPFILDLLLRRSPEDLGNPSRVTIFVIVEWAVALALLAIVLFWERQPLSSIGMKKMSRRDVLWGLGGFVIGVITFFFTTPLVNALGLESTSGGIERLAQVSIGLRIVVVITAGVTEEILFRGYPIERLTTLTGRIGVGATIAYVLFVLLHIPFWGLGGTIQIGVWSLVVTFLYVKTRNLPACMLMHILNDAYAFLLLPMLLLR